MKCEPLFLAVLLLNLGSAVALEETKICYILDGILFVYGIILTILYCRMKMGSGKNASQPQNKPKEEGIYTGLTVPPSPGYLRNHRQATERNGVT